MSCYCESSPSMFVETWPKARKIHKCCECRRPIKIGDEYERVAGVWDGDFAHFKTCERCAGLRAALAEVLCPCYGGLREGYSDYLHDLLSEEGAEAQYASVFLAQKIETLDDKELEDANQSI